VVVAATGDDEDNLVVSLLAKQEFAVPRVIARVNHPKNEWLFNENWGVDLSVSTPHLITALVEEAVSVGPVGAHPSVRRRSGSPGGVTLADDSPVIRPSPARCRRSAQRDSRRHHPRRTRVMPRGDSVFEPGDEVLAMVTPESEEDVRQILTGG